MWIKSSFTTPAVAAISFCLIGGTVPAAAYADLGDQLFKLLADDGAAVDRRNRLADRRRQQGSDDPSPYQVLDPQQPLKESFGPNPDWPYHR